MQAPTVSCSTVHRRLLFVLSMAAGISLYSVAAVQEETAWASVFEEDFENAPANTPVAEPWSQHHPRRQVIVTDQVALSGKQAAMFRYEVTEKGTLDEEAGMFRIETALPREKPAEPEIYRVSWAVRFRAESATAAAFAVRGPSWRKPFSVYNSMNMLILSAAENEPIWNPAVPDTWYRLVVILDEESETFELSIGPADGTQTNFFSRRAVHPDSLPARYLFFGYIGAIVRYGQGRVAYIDDIRVERRVEQESVIRTSISNSNSKHVEQKPAPAVPAQNE